MKTHLVRVRVRVWLRLRVRVGIRVCSSMKTHLVGV
tara:strand:- start:100 stop:207 length:108 start_codon:yes stop_codon:yes gene_type:complete